MPYATIEDLPVSLRTRLPAHAQEIFRNAFNGAWLGYGASTPDGREEIAFKVAWAAVKRRYRKQGDHWVARRA